MKVICPVCKREGHISPIQEIKMGSGYSHLLAERWPWFRRYSLMCECHYEEHGELGLNFTVYLTKEQADAYEAEKTRTYIGTVID